MFKVQKKMCGTCIYRPDSMLDIKELERQAADTKLKGHFAKFRECHHGRKGTCCRGFWEKHKDHFDAGQLAQRLNVVVFVEEDTWNSKKLKKRSTTTSATPAARRPRHAKVSKNSSTRSR